MTRFWEPLPNDRVRALVNGWGTVPIESLYTKVQVVAYDLERNGRPFEALGLLSAACEVTSNPSTIAELALAAGEIAANCAEPVAAERAVTVARAAIEAGGGELGPQWLLVRGHALGDLGHVGEALEVYALARSGFSERGDASGVALVDQNVGALLHDCGDHERALKLLTDAAAVFTRLGHDDSLRACWLSISPALRCLDRLDEAVVVNEQLIGSLRAAGDQMVLGHALVNFGHVHVERCDHQAAEECYLEALSLYRRIGLVSDEAVCLSSLGYLARTDGRLELALSLQQRAEGVFQAHHRPADLAIVRYQLAITSLHLGRWAEAKRYAELATDVPGTDLDPALALSVALDHLGDHAGAERERQGSSNVRMNEPCDKNSPSCPEPAHRRFDGS